ncbi:cellulose biosynthesis protein BcsQ [Paraburkholderia sp. BL10I2N1]|uniref:cellulose biosynthesis protein BcsQ n=1 Tax=Paraburkholderia sp. BL10I2N1 TaxID=1938796 RepID=UPI00105B31AF|nr:cellulose biosynthesis protein BcsQ [Paraburkholderia sp. BL10I2N1]TDN63427.1 chromosome partitioning protein [Paraburkholderia sp. BL10I2N1]
MKVIAVVSAKGGVGKTTLAANLASVLASRGRRVIAIDLDPQNALRLHFGIALDSIDGLSRATLSGDSWQTVMMDGIDGVTVVPYGAVVEDDRRRFEAHLDRDPLWIAQTLASLGLDAADVVIIDTPPGSSTYTRSALCAASFALNVVLADAASYAAIPLMERLIETYAAPRPEFGGEGYVINQVDQSRQLSKDVLKVLRQLLGARLFSGVIHADEAISEALACDTTLIHYDPLSQAAADLRACGDWLLASIGQAGLAPGSAGSAGNAGNVPRNVA